VDFVKHPQRPRLISFCSSLGREFQNARSYALGIRHPAKPQLFLPAAVPLFAAKNYRDLMKGRFTQWRERACLLPAI
jgi:hypothetical protein